MFNVVVTERTESNDVTVIIKPNIEGNKVDKKVKNPLTDLNHRIRSRLTALRLKKNNVSEITFSNFSINALKAIQEHYVKYTKIGDIFNILSIEYYNPTCVILEEIPSKDDLKFVINHLLARVDLIENLNLLILRNFNKNFLEDLNDIKFPSKLNLRIEHSDIEILKKLQTIKLSEGKIEFSIYKAEIVKKKSKYNTKSKAVSNLSSESEHKIDVGTDEEKSMSDSNPDLNRENIISNGEKDSNKEFPNNINIGTKSVSPINQLPKTSLSIQPIISATPAIAVSDASLDIFRIIRTIVSDVKTNPLSLNHSFFKPLNLIESVAGVPLAEAEYHRNIKDLKNQLDALNEQLEIKAVDQEKVHALQDEITILKQDNEHLKSELAAIVSGDQSGLLKYVLEATQLREKNQQQIREIEDLKIKLSAQESNNKRKRPEEDNYTSNKQARVEGQHAHNNIPQNSLAGSVNTNEHLVYTASPRLSFFTSTATTTVANTNSLPFQHPSNS